MNSIGIGFRALSRRTPTTANFANKRSCFAKLQRKSLLATVARFSPTSARTLSWWWSLELRALNSQFVSSSLPGGLRVTSRNMGSGGSKSNDKKGKAAPAEGEGQQQAADQPRRQQEAQEQAAAEKTLCLSEGKSEPQQQVEQAATVELEGEKMSEEYVEAVVAKASEFGDNV